MKREINLPLSLWASLDALALHEGEHVDDLIWKALNRDLYRRARAKRAVRPDERLVAPLRALLAEDFAHASGWQDLQTRLRRKGYHLREAGGGLALHEQASGQRMCKASDLGNSYGALIARFGHGLPGHSHRHVETRVLATRTSSQ